MSTYTAYKSLLRRIIATDVPVYTSKGACDHIDVLNSQFIIIKHDVEDRPDKALKISEIEHAIGIAATYYVHSFFLNDPTALSILKRIQSLGHEIGYHYDVLDSNNGDREAAVREFRGTLARFAANGFNIRTVCPHGNPLKQRIGYSSNKDFLLDTEIRQLFGDIVDIYTTFPDMVPEPYLYVSDAGYAYSCRDAKTTKTDATEKMHPLDNEDEILRLIKEGRSMILSTHTHRYCASGAVYAVRMAIFRCARPAARTLYHTKCGKYLLNKFYFLAKRI